MNNSTIIAGEAQSSLTEIMLEFVRAAVLERLPVIPQDVEIDWDRLMDVATKQGLLALVWDGICKLPVEQQPPRQQRINWGLSAQEIWNDYYLHKRVLSDIVLKCKQNDIKVLLLKGIGLSGIYPKCESRPSGDIDIFLFGEYEKGNLLLSDNNYSFGGKHSSFRYEGVLVENHQNFFYHGTEVQRKVDDYLFSNISKSILCEGGYYILPAVAGLVHLLLHSMVHLNNPQEHITIRNVVDVASYILFYQSHLDPVKCGETMRQLGMEKIFDLFLQLSEWVLDENFSQYRNVLVKKSEDLDCAITLLIDDFLRSPKFDNHSFLKQLRQHYVYHKTTKWKYSYLPNWKTLNNNLFKEQLSFFIKSILGIPFNESIKNR